MRATGRMCLAAAAALSLVFPGSAGASATVDITEANASGGTATVKGTAAFPAITTAQSVTTPDIQVGGQFGAQEVSNAAGLNLTDAKILPINGGLRFIWEVANMPSEVPPEGVRYNWAINIGDNVYQLQAKRTSMASVNTMEDPKGHAEQLAGQKGFFQLRGNCVTNYFPPPAPTVNGCYHYGFLNGSFDVANKRVTMDWPFETRDAINRIVAPDFKPGAVLTPHDGSKSAGMSIAATFQAVVSNSSLGNYINGWAPYFIGGRVQIGVANQSVAPEEVGYGAPVALTGNTFSTTVSGLNAITNTVFVRACNGATCTYDSERVIF